MSNIIGLPFDDWVKSQIDVRQDALGRKVNISHDNLKYYTKSVRGFLPEKKTEI